MSKHTQWLSVGVALVACSPLAAVAAEQSTLEEVIVTATKTGESQAQRTPLAMTVLGGDKLLESGVVNVKDLVSLTPNLSIAQATVNAEIYIRGVGSNNVFAGSDADVTMQVDGVPMSRAFTQLNDFIDVERIEVLRGPQGTLYGRNAVGGTINIISHKPSDELRGQVVASFGDFSMKQGQAYVSGAIIPGKLQASISGNIVQHDAYFRNIVPGKSDIGNADRSGVRAQLRYVPTDKLELITRADYASSNSHPDSYSHILSPYPFGPLANTTIGNRDLVALDGDQQATTRSWGISEEANYAFNDALALRSVTAYRNGYYNLTNDSDGTDYFQNEGIQRTRNLALTQEFNLTARRDRWNGVVGVFYAHEREWAFVNATVPPGVGVPAAASARPQTEPFSGLTSKAVFAQGTFHVTDTVNVTAGIRYTQDDKSLDSLFTRISLNPATFGVSAPGFPFIASVDRKFTGTTPKLGVDWQATPELLAYASVTKGYKSGGTNYAATNVAAMAFAPETLVSYEAGMKSEWLGHRLRLNVTAFKYDYKDLQVQSLIGPGNVAIGNAATATINGGELELTVKPTANLLLTANLAVLSAKYDSFSAASVPGALRAFLVGDPQYSAATSTYNATGKTLNAAPKTSYGATAQYEHPITSGKLFMRAEYSWQDRVEYDPSNARIMGQDAFNLVNLSVGYRNESGKWNAQILARNVGDTTYYITKAANGVVPAGLAGAPRTLALQLTKNW
jgi:iron complex outermembrane receptor protein